MLFLIQKFKKIILGTIDNKIISLFKNIEFVIKAMVRFEPLFLILIPIGTFTTTALKYLWPIFIKIVIDIIENGEGNSSSLLVIVCAFLVFQLLLSMMDSFFTNEIFWRYMHVRFELIYEKNLKIMSMDYEKIEDKDILDCYKKADNACNSNKEGIEGMMRVITNLSIYSAVTLMGIFIIGIMDPLIVVVIVAFSIVSFNILNITNRIAKKDVWDPISTWQRKQEYIKNVTMDFSYAKEIRMYGLRSWLLNRYSEINQVFYNAQKSNEKISAIATGGYHILWTLCQVIIYGWLLYCVIYNELKIGTFTLYIASTTTLFEGMKRWLDEIANLFARSREVSDFRRFIELPLVEEGDRNIIIKNLDNYVFTFQNVSFKYPNSERYVLKNINLSFKAGEKLAIVGLNGAGKTTIVKLLMRLYEPTKGAILLNGVDVRFYNKQMYYQLFAPVFQDYQIYASSLKENVSMKRQEEINDETVKNALIGAGMIEKVHGLPEGMDTELLKVLYEDGVDLSGGEKQKVSLARALYKKAPIIILDEPTSAYDALAENIFYDKIKKYMNTVILISHKLNITRLCDDIAIFKDGELVEYGTHRELIEKKGMYEKMFSTQAQYYEVGCVHKKEAFYE